MEEEGATARRKGLLRSGTNFMELSPSIYKLLPPEMSSGLSTETILLGLLNKSICILQVLPILIRCLLLCFIVVVLNV